MKIVSRVGRRTIDIETFILMYKTKLDIVEKRIRETKKGQKEVWTAKKGPKNTYSWEQL